MARYYFHLECGGDTTPDDEGQDFTTIELVKQEARAVAYELARNKTADELVGQFVLVRDAEGMVIFRVPLSP
jgi:hypothetical protein